MSLRALRRSILDHEQSSGKRDLVARRNFNHKLHALRGGGPNKNKMLLKYRGSIEGRFLLKQTDSRAILTKDELIDMIKDETSDVKQCTLFYLKLLQTIIGIRRRVKKMSESGKQTVIDNETLCDEKCSELKSKHTCVQTHNNECVEASKKTCKGVYCDRTTEYTYAKKGFLTEFIDELLIKKTHKTRPTLDEKDIQQLAPKIITEYEKDYESLLRLDDQFIRYISDKAYRFLRKYRNLTTPEKPKGQSYPPELEEELRLKMESHNQGGAV